MAEEQKRVFEFGPYRMDACRKLLLRAGRPVHLTSKALDALLILVERSGHVVSKDQLMKALWPNTFVQEANLTQHISMVRKALRETPKDHRYIVTLPGEGYRFAENVRVVSPESPVIGTNAHSVSRWVKATSKMGTPAPQSLLQSLTMRETPAMTNAQAEAILSELRQIRRMMQKPRPGKLGYRIHVRQRRAERLTG